MRVLVVNAGSSSLKLRVVDGGRVVDRRDVGAPGAGTDDELDGFVRSAGRLDGSGHRVVHGGNRFVQPVVVDDEVRAALGDLHGLAPLHNPPATRAIDALRRLRPDLPAVACFDTAFHAGMPDAAARYALPAEWTDGWGVRRYGFHGLSCRWALTRAAAMVGRPAEQLRVVICHLGGGASVTAVRYGRSVDTTMGFTPVAGLIMGTRSGDVDPGALAWLATRGVGGAELADALERRSGLLALSGVTGDLKELLDRREGGEPGPTAALAAYLHRLRGGIAAMAAAAGGLDVLVFTGGVGERAAAVRREAAEGLAWMGVGVDPGRNAAVDGDAEVTGKGAAVRTLVVAAREELVVAADAERILSGAPTVAGGTGE